MSRLVLREIEPGDGPAIARIMRRITVLHRRVDMNLEAIYEQLAVQQRIVGVVVEVAESSGEDGVPSLVGAAFSGFLDADFAADYRCHPRPLLTSEVLGSCLAGQCHLLDPAGQAAGNRGGGLDLAVLEMAVAVPDPASQSHRDVLHLIYGAHLEFLRGYNVRAIMTEASAEFEHLVAGTGLKSVHDMRLEPGNDIVAPPGRSPHRKLFAISRSDLPDLPASSAASVVMTYVPPSLSLTPREQRFLAVALKGLTDNALAGALSVSPNAVKQTWRNIYSHVSGVLPDILGSTNEDSNGANRGSEKRRKVLVHIRNNLQELRPHHLRRK